MNISSCLAKISKKHAIKWVVWGIGSVIALAIVFVAGAFLWFRFWMLPHLNDYRQNLEHYLSQSLERHVSIERLTGQWDQIAPQFTLYGIRVSNPQGGAALSLTSVSVVPSWMSLVQQKWLLSKVSLNEPHVDVWRNVDGLFYINGMAIKPQNNTDHQPLNWLLQQPSVQIHNAYLSWQDDLTGLPKLGLRQMQLELSKGLFKHRLKLAGTPVAALGKGFELEASWRGDDVNAWRQWNGTAKVLINTASVGVWSRYWQNMGLLSKGEGQGKISLAFSEGSIASLDADMRLQQAAYTSLSSQELALPLAQGRLHLERQARGHYALTANDLTLASASGLAFNRATINGEWSDQNGGFLTLDNANVEHLYPFARALGLGELPLFTHFSPHGRLQALKLQWTGAWKKPKTWSVNTRFLQLAWKPFAELPGVSGASGSIQFDQQGGVLSLDSGKSALNYPLVFPETLLFEQLKGQVQWKHGENPLLVDIQKLEFANADLKGQLQGTYHYSGQGPGQANLRAALTSIPVARVYHYLPHQIPQDTAIWLKQSLKGGVANNVTMALQGDLSQFPFHKGRGGIFDVNAQVNNGIIKYDPLWPALENIQAHLRFKNETMEIAARQASTMHIPLQSVQVTIPDLSVDHPVLRVQGKAKDTLARLLQFPEHSPMDRDLVNFTRSITARGSAELNLTLAIPLSGKATTRIDGKLDFQRNQLRFNDLPIPPLDEVTGTLHFDEHGERSEGIHFKGLGGAFTMAMRPMAPQRLQFTLDGSANSQQLLHYYVPKLAPYVTGQSTYSLRFDVQDGLKNFEVRSDLKGTAVKLPIPLMKKPDESLPFLLKTIGMDNKHPFPSTWALTLGKHVAGQLLFASNGHWQGLSLGVGNNPEAGQAKRGIHIRWSWPQIHYADWQPLLAQASQAGSTNMSTANVLPHPIEVKVKTPDFKGPIGLTDVSAHASKYRAAEPWNVTIQSRQLAGTIEYQQAADRWQGHLERLALVKSQLHALDSWFDDSSGAQTHSTWPEVVLTIKNFNWEGRSLGSVNLNARPQGNRWVIAPLVMKSNAGTLQADLNILPNAIQADFQLAIQNGGELLRRIGYDNVIKGGSGTLSGKLNWSKRGDFDLERVSGNLSLDIEKGQFDKADPGVARLLGVLSLRSLARRVRLDFTDVFSPGFAFDSLKGALNIKEGIFYTQDLKMKGPAANVAIAGEVDLPASTQALTIHVEPQASESVALAAGAALVNPVAGLVTLAAQKILQDPVGKILSVDYRVTGTLNDPVVTRVKAEQSKTP